MFSPTKKIAGLLHAVLPENSDTDKTSTKFVDTGIPVMLEKMQKAGADLAHHPNLYGGWCKYAYQYYFK